jgi:hypothetical protein
MYVLTAVALRYLLLAAHIVWQVCGILLTNGSKMINNHFADGSLLFVREERYSMDVVLASIDTFYFALGDAINAQKTNFSLVGLDPPPNWILTTWSYIYPEIIV